MVSIGLKLSKIAQNVPNESKWPTLASWYTPRPCYINNPIAGLRSQRTSRQVELQQNSYCRLKKLCVGVLDA